MKKWKLRAIFFLTIVTFHSAKSDLFGGDILVLTQILSQSAMQLTKLKELLGTAENNINLVKEINQGINDSLNLIRTNNLSQEPGLYGNWTNTKEAIDKLKSLYGETEETISSVQKDTDQNIAEAVVLNNYNYKYAKELDEIGEKIKDASHSVSPGGAQKLTAQALGVLIHAMNQNLRTQATMMKLSAQTAAVNNSKEKALVREYKLATKDLANQMQNKKHDFKIPRF